MDNVMSCLGNFVGALNFGLDIFRSNFHKKKSGMLFFECAQQINKNIGFFSVVNISSAVYVNGGYNERTVDLCCSVEIFY